ncbi:unnamed protein product [Closterium sp. NIES-65]|nr:unnamed protein product [Closterium sp. NIES-65]
MMVSHLRCNDFDSAAVNAVADPVAGDGNDSHVSDATNSRSSFGFPVSLFLCPILFPVFRPYYLPPRSLISPAAPHLFPSKTPEQHPKEKYHPLGSARIALLGLQRVRVVVVPLGRGRPGLQPKDPCSRRSLLGRSGRGRWRKGAGKAQGQGGKQGEGAGEEQGQGQGNGQGHGQGQELGADQGKGEGHGQEQGQGQGKGLGETQGNAEGRMLQEGEEAPQQRLWGDQAQRTGESSERGNARDGEASTGIDGGLVVVTAVGEKVEVRGGKLHEVEEREGEVREGEECVENGVEQEGSRGVGANGPVLVEQQGGETANGALTGDSSFDLSFDLLPFAAADGAESDDGRGDHHADGSSAVDGGSMWCEDNIDPWQFGCLSTIEAVVYALQILEPDNRVKLDELLEVFNSMVIDQVRCIS